MTALTETIINLYAMTDADIAQLEATLYEQLRLSYLERIRTLAIQHGVNNPSVTLASEQADALRRKAHEDAAKIVATYNRELRSQVNAIAARNPTGDRAYFIGTLASWGRSRDEYKTLQIAMYTILWAGAYGFDLFVTRNNLQYQLFRAVGASPVCPDCMRIVQAGIVNYNYVQENPLPFHQNCAHEWSTVNASDLTENGRLIWLGA